MIYDAHEDLPRQIMSKHWISPLIRRPVAGLAAVVENFSVRCFDAVVAATPPIAARFPPDKSVTVQNFPLLSQFLSVAAEPYATRPPHIAYIGGIAPIRGSVEMLTAFELLSSRHANARLELAGPFAPSRHQDELRQLSGWQSVSYHGVIDRNGIAGLLGSTRAGLVVLHPTLNYLDALPVKMFEYMAAGLPVIASNFPLWRDIVEKAQCGLTVDPLQPAAIADAMAWILEHPVEAEAMGRRGREAVQKRYNWNPEAEKLRVLYEDRLTQNAGKSE